MRCLLCTNNFNAIVIVVAVVVIIFVAQHDPSHHDIHYVAAFASPSQRRHGWKIIANRVKSPGWPSSSMPAVAVGRSVARSVTSSSSSSSSLSLSSTTREKEAWNGEVTPDGGGMIRGCSLTCISETEWTITIDGIEADLGRFSDAIYQKIIKDAKRQNFQGFRPGTIPPHLEPTYRAFTMDECARETIIEAMQQNSIRPFDNTRNELRFIEFRIPPPPIKNQKSKKSKKKQPPQKVNDDHVVTTTIDAFNKEDDTNNKSSDHWLSYATMKEAIDAGWRPGQSFSFVANHCRGQVIKQQQDEAEGARPLGMTY